MDKFELRGSYFIGVICKDGIVIGADSRGTFLENGKTMAFFDSVQKVFVVRNCVVCICGLIAIGNRFISSILEDFERLLPIDVVHQNVLDEFEKNFLTLNPLFKSDFETLRITSYGYIDGRPSIYVLKNKILAANRAVVSGDNLSKFGNGIYTADFCLTKTCSEIAPQIEGEILDYAERNKKASEIGGDIMLVKIDRNNNITWMKNQPLKKNWLTTQDLIIDYRQGNVPITFLNESFEKTFREDHPLF